MAEEIAVLRGGDRDGDTTTVDGGTTRLLAPSRAPGLLDVYEATEETAEVPGNSRRAVVFEHTGQEPAGDLAPELQHAPAPLEATAGVPSRDDAPGR